MDVRLKTYIEVEYAVFNHEVTAAFGHRYEFVADWEAINGAVYAFNDIDGGVSDYERRKLDAFKTTGQGTFLAPLLLQELVTMGRIAPGDYLVKVSW